MLRHRFNTRSQKPGETFQTYLVDLRNKAEGCDFGDKKEEFIRDRIVVGIGNDTVRKYLLKESDLTLDKAIEICQLHELAESDNKSVNQDPDVNAIKPKRFFKKPAQPTTSNCKYCGNTHPRRKCPAFGTKCQLCGKYNHFAAVCMSSDQQSPQKPQSKPQQPRPSSGKFNKRTQQQQRRNMHELEYEEEYCDDDYEESFQINPTSGL